MRRAIPVLLAAAALAAAQWVEDSIEVGGNFVGDLAYNSREDVVYGRSNTGDFVFALSCDSHRIVSRIPMNYPLGIAYDSLDNKLYCAFGVGGDESLMVVNGVTHQRLRAIPLLSANRVVWDARRNRLAVSCGSEDRVAIVDCVTDSVIATVDVGHYPLRLHLNTRHDKLYVQNYDGCTISIIDLESLQVVGAVGAQYPLTGYYSESVDKYYAADGLNRVVVIDGATDSVLCRPYFPNSGVAFASAGNRRSRLIMLAFSGMNQNGGVVHVLDGDADTVLSSLPVGREPWALCWSMTSDLVYCANSISNNLSVILGDGSAVTKTIRVGDYPFVFQAVPRHDRVYVGHLGGRHVYVIKDRAGGIAEQEPVGVERLLGPTVMRASDLVRFDGRILDALGREVRTAISDFALRSPHLPPGVYFLKSERRSPNAEPPTRKVVVR